MSLCRRISTLTFAALLLAISAAAQQPAQPREQRSVADSAMLDALVVEQVRADAANRAAVRALLDRPEVQTVAARAGLDLERAKTAVTTLEGAELQEIADRARRVEAGLAGGASTLTISTTTIIIILLVVILLIVAID